jgi:hypothetical protein
MQAHQGLHGIGNNHTNNHQAQFVRLRLPFFSDSIQFTLVRRCETEYSKVSN